MKTKLLLIFILITKLSLANSDSLMIEKLKVQNEKLSSQLSEQSKTNQLLELSLENYNHRTSSLEILVGILGGLVGLISVAIPLIIYLFQIRPAEKIIEEVKDVDKTVENKLQAYLKDEEKKRIDKALDDLSDSNEKISNDASMILSFNQTHDFSNEQLFKTYRLLKGDLPFGKKSVLAMILATKKNEFADEFFTDILKSPSAQMFLHQTIKYFSLSGLQGNLNKIVEYILSANDATNNQAMIISNYISVGINMMMNSTKSFEALINDPILNSGLDKDIRKQLVNSFSGQASVYGVEEVLNESLLSKGLNEKE